MFSSCKKRKKEKQTTLKREITYNIYYRTAFVTLNFFPYTRENFSNLVYTLFEYLIRYTNDE